MVKRLNDSILTKWAKDFYLSNENLLRSLNCYYSHNVLRKQKYLSLLKANKETSYKKTKLPNYLTYNTLSEKINEIEIGTPNDVSDLVPDENPIRGKYRIPAEYILRLARFCSVVNINCNDKLQEFPNLFCKNPSSLLFVLSVGGDGAPGIGTAFLISFLNVAAHIASSEEQFLLFGADVNESCVLDSMLDSF